MIVLPTTLCAAAAAAIINLWLAFRVLQMRFRHQVVHGDNSVGPLARRMRAQLNFVENAPFVLLLIAAIELAGRGGLWLGIVAGVFLLGRVAHGFGMDGEQVTVLRRVGVAITQLTLLGLAVVAVLVATGRM